MFKVVHLQKSYLKHNLFEIIRHTFEQNRSFYLKNLQYIVLSKSEIY